MAQLGALEIQTLAKIVDELDYYEILQIAPGASTPDIKKAYYDSSRAFHPDARRDLPDAVRIECERISKRVTEAYCVLRDPRKRKVYDDRRAGESGPRMALAEAKAEHRRAQSEVQGKTPQGRQYFRKSVQDHERGNTKGAIQNLQMALTFEPNNSSFQKRLTELRTRA